MLNIETKPLVTIIVPIYNAEPWIRRCLDSLVYQTLENIEIIAVNKGSTDGTWNILNEYQHDFPNKVFIAEIEPSNGPGAGRNYGLKHARADYIAFADADDYFDYKAMELMYDKAQQEDYDMVCCASYDVRGKEYKKTRVLTEVDSKYMMKNASMVFWNKLIKKDLFDTVGAVPENIVFEDIAYVSTLISYAKKIGYVNEPLYYYILREDSGVNDLKSDRILHSLRAYEIAIEKCNPILKDELIASVAHRIIHDLQEARWTYADKFIDYIIKNRSLFDGANLSEKDKTFLDSVYSINYAPMPKTIIVNGFVKIDENWLKKIKERAFDSDTEILILNETNCDVNTTDVVRKAYQKMDFTFVAEYFAIEKIYSQGGIYLSSNIELLNYLNYLRYFQSFFSYLDMTSFSNDIFGGIKGNSFFNCLLETYEGELASDSLSDKIKNILIIKNKMILDAKQNFLSNDISLFSPDVMVTGTQKKLQICLHSFKDKVGQDEYITLKRNTFDMFLNQN